MPTRERFVTNHDMAELCHLQPRWRRLRAIGQKMASRKVQASVFILGLASVTGYCLWHQHNQHVNRVVAQIKSQAVAKADSPLGVIAPESTNNGGRDLLARAQLENELLYSDLQSFVCDEHIDRYKGRLTGETGRQIDTVTARVSFENGVEHYSDIHQNSRERASLSSLPGAWSEGEFGTLLRQTHTLLGTQPVTLKADSELGGTPAAVYTIEVGEQDSPWDLVINGTSYKVPFRTDVWVSKESGRILKIERTSTSIPPGMGISELRWSVTLDPVNMEGKTWLLPKAGEYEVQYADSRRREWNVMTFSGYRRYGSRVVLHF